MINGLLILSTTLTVSVVALCILLYKRSTESLVQSRLQYQMLANLDMAFKDLEKNQISMRTRIDQLSTDVLQREIYQNADDRHLLAIKSAKQGKGLGELIQLHGLSTDEAALIISLHSPRANTVDLIVRNANLLDPAVAEEI